MVLDLATPKRKLTRLLRITPGRSEEHAMIGMVNMLASVPVGQVVSLEICSDHTGIHFYTRTDSALSTIRHLIQGHYPQSVLDDVVDKDFVEIGPDEQAMSRMLTVNGPPFLPIRTFTESELANPGADPLVTLLGTLANLEPGERVFTRLLINRLPPNWAAEFAGMAMSGPGSVNQQQAEQNRSSGASSASFTTGDFLKIGLLGLAVIAFFGWQAYQDGNTLLLAGLASSPVALGAGALLLRKMMKKESPAYYDPSLILPRINGAGFTAELQVTSVVPIVEGFARNQRLLDMVASAYSQLDNPLGARFESSEDYRGVPPEDRLLEFGGLKEKKTGLNRMLTGPNSDLSTLGASEVASLWHPPRPSDDHFPVHRQGAKVLPPTFTSSEGAEVGTTVGAAAEPVFLPGDSLRRHQFLVARTRMGKSTFIQNEIEYKMKEKAAGRDNDAIVVIDPHADLIEALMGVVPPELAIDGKVKLIDLGDDKRVPGINLLDTQVFTGRDRTTDSIVRVAKGLWGNWWGPRMQNILEHAVKTLHEANSHESISRQAQYTLLDVQDILVDEAAKDKVLAKTTDPFLERWWSNDFGKWDERYRNEAISPVQTRLSFYSSSEKARLILGQPKSTLDIQKAIQDGDILFVSTAQGTVGRDVAGLIGACVLNLVDSVIRQQGELPPEKRRSVMLAVDEMQAIPGVDYEAMLGEVGKFGGALLLATQSLSKVDEISPTMRDVILANNGLLVVWQVAAVDAERLVKELGSEKITIDDITSLPVHHCYVRATSDGQRMPAFSMQVRRPTTGHPGIAEAIRRGNEKYTLTVEDAKEIVESAMYEKVKDRMKSRADETGYLRMDVNAKSDATSTTRQPQNQNGPKKSKTRKRKRKNKSKRQDASQEGQRDSMNSNTP